MTTFEFIKHARREVYNWFFAKYSEESKTVAFSPDDVFVVWECKILQNHKAILAAPTPDNYMFEVTYNGDAHVFYFDVYDKIRNYPFYGEN